ncbi:RNA polymerase sigma factor FliA [Oceanicoccus sp. KOV_DT_Chl]|uniref:RNA polymerase sigma factor FliA n=1 Tax=Oceanicoccus sp. KOV_DT_Chl TaxID=1904639 RepID=UPI000C7CA676|nr:RNA polymerase sigma factor FliA [Oceanicoccus sp. KOV_DT_Chl]
MYNDVDKPSMEDMVERYAPLVKRIAHHLLARMPSSVLVEDLVQAGLIGLMEAARNYDVSKGASFETYAGIRIRGAMIDDVRRGDWAPRSVHRNSRRVSEAIRTVESRFGRDASDNEVAAELGVELDEYYSIIKDSASSKLFSYDELISGDDRPEEQLPSSAADPLDGIQSDALRRGLAAAIATLPERERLVLALYYDEELNLKEIGLVLGVSESRVSQIHSQAALRLRSRLVDWQSNPPSE